VTLKLDAANKDFLALEIAIQAGCCWTYDADFLALELRMTGWLLLDLFCLALKALPSILSMKGDLQKTRFFRWF